MAEASGQLSRSDRFAVRSKGLSITLMTVCVVLALSLWFSVSAVVPALKVEYGLAAGRAALMSSAVSVGFVLGTLASALLGLADRLHPRHFFMLCALTGATANALILAVSPTSMAAVGLRLVTGACMAGIYPVGMKMAATWARGDTGVLVGLLVGALCLGSATPHLLNAYNGLDWQATMILASLLAAGAGVLINFVGLGPALRSIPPFEPAYITHAWREIPLRLTNLGYWGHKWENYAMWAWIGVFLQASFARSLESAADAAFYAGLITFGVVAAGGVGCLIGGVIADRAGRTLVTISALSLSGACAVIAGFLFGGDPWLLSVVCILWGIMVVADSPQFSSCIIELSDRSHVGTMLTVQTCVGFLITLASIHLIPFLVAAVGWRYAFSTLAVGPVLGILSMARLRRHPAALQLAGGRR